jgi:hypothetical protein
MSSRSLLFLLIAFSCFSAKAQRDSAVSNSTGFVSLYSGTLLGKRGTGPSVCAALTGGLRYNRFNIGVGFGYDTYSQWQLLPVFSELGYDLIARRNYAVFVQVQAGFATAWTTSTQQFGFRNNNEGGYFWHPLLGCRLQQGKIRLYFAAGYKFQNLTYEQTPTWIDLGWGGSKTKVNMDLQRMSLLMGIGLW